MMFKIKLLIILALPLFMLSCGDPSVDLTEAKYEPKIVIDGYIYPDRPVEDIRVMRNFPLNQNINIADVVLYDAEVKLIDIETGMSYILTFDQQKFSFRYTGSDLIISGGKKYKIEINASIEGINLHASSITQVPQTGLSALQKNLGEMKYREQYNSGAVKKFNIQFTPAPGSEFHAYAIEALSPSLESFIYDNAYFTDLDTNDVKEDFDRYKQEFGWLQNSKPSANRLELDIEWHSIWFYGDYRVILYAGDDNFKNFLITHGNVMEFDGNFHEPKFNIEGDGIGVFGSAVTDTVYFKILR